MENRSFQNVVSGKEPLAQLPGAKSRVAADGNQRHAHQAQVPESEQFGKNDRSVVAHKAGSYSGLNGGSDLGKKPNLASDAPLPRLGRQQLIRETQGIVLHFPIKKVAEWQDTTEKAVESQRNGESAMSLLAAANLSRSNPRARAMFAKLFGITGRMADPDFMEGWARFMAWHEREQQRAENGPAEACDEAMVDLFGEGH